MSLEQKIQSCRICVDCPRYLPALPVEPRPVVILSKTAKVAIAGQAPGLRVYETGLPFNDRSGDRLREWLGVNKQVFYDRQRFAIIPMGFCFPGYNMHKSDLPPRRECREVWHEQVFQSMPQIELVLAIGAYAQNWHIDNNPYKTVSQTVQEWEKIIQHKQHRGYTVIPLPHPSWRNTSWLARNPWFKTELLPQLQALIHHYK